MKRVFDIDVLEAGWPAVASSTATSSLEKRSGRSSQPVAKKSAICCELRRINCPGAGDEQPT
jgi:hypothetical protein